MTTTETQGFTIIAALRSRGSLPPLTPQGTWHPGLERDIAALKNGDLAGPHPESAFCPSAWKAALHLWNDGLDAAHDLIQHDENATSAALHGIVHRREGDYGNAKYWFRKAGDHPAYHGLQSRADAYLAQCRLPDGQLGSAIASIEGQGSWNAFLFANVVEMHEARVGDSPVRETLEQLQQLELEAFLRYLAGRMGMAFEDIL